jgi:putative glutamine amidotransferase
MAASPLIGASTSIALSKDGERAVLNSTYLAAVQAAGGVPVLLPPQLDERARETLFLRLDGVLLTGGGDMDPARFGETPHPTVAGVSPDRDRLEIALVEHALGRRLPVLAICRGVQVLNVALGGSLYQDVPSQIDTQVQHDQTRPRHEPTHKVTIEEDSRLADVLGATQLEVNSFHHQGIKALGRGLRAVAHSDDGLIEGAELPERERFVLGVQWHPEELAVHPDGDSARRLFRALIGACA